jgi:hypothetical protein
MKKLLAIALIAASFTACNDGEKKETETIGSDTVTQVTSTPDTNTVIRDTTVTTTTTDANKMSADTTKH